MKRRLGASAASALVAVALATVPSPNAVKPAVVKAPVADGKNFGKTTPFSATMKKLNTGAAPAAHAERSGSPSKNGSPTATVPTPLRKLRLFKRNTRPVAVSALDLTVHLRTAS